MTRRTLTFVVWGLVASAFVLAQCAAAVTKRIPTLGDLIRAIVRNPISRALCLAGWLWLGWHFFVRSSR